MPPLLEVGPVTQKVGRFIRVVGSAADEAAKPRMTPVLQSVVAACKITRQTMDEEENLYKGKRVNTVKANLPIKAIGHYEQGRAERLEGPSCNCRRTRYCTQKRTETTKTL